MGFRFRACGWVVSYFLSYPSRVSRRCAVLPVCVGILVGQIHAADLWLSENGVPRVSLITSMKWTSLLSKASPDTALYPERWSAASLWRMRLSLSAHVSSALTANVAYEHRARLVSAGSGAGGGFGILPSVTSAAYRIRQGDDRLLEVGGTFSYRHELDRAYLTFERGGHQFTLGRQAVGWGRGVMFGAVDIFAPFTPLESDREWRRGIDAARANVRLTDLLSFEMMAAFGESLNASSFVGRLQGYVGNVDGEIILGRRCDDHMYAVTLSSAVGNAEVHGELALFQTPEPLPDGGLFGRDDWTCKAVLGGSYSFDILGGVWLVGEYHYSGFGIEDVSDFSERLHEVDVVERYSRGDAQILGQHAGAAQAVFGLGSEHPVNLTWLFSPKDGSGVVVASVSWVFSDSVTLMAAGYLPHGAKPEAGELQSEYGATPAAELLQISFCY